MEINKEGKIVLRINASSLKLSRCMLAWHRTVVQGYREPMFGAAMIYGSAIHKFIDTMFKTDGRMDLARDAALKTFNVPKIDNRRSRHLSDATHMITSCLLLWEDYIQKDQEFSVVKLNTKCWWCGGEGWLVFNSTPDSRDICSHCKGSKTLLQPATEVTFSIPYYEDAKIVVFLEGTVDRIGKIKNGCYAIGDYKTTSTADSEVFLEPYEMSSQLRFYVLSLKLMAKLYPDSILGQIGATRVGAFVDGVFIRPKCSENSYARSAVFQFPEDDMAEYQVQLYSAINRLINAVLGSTYQCREGILNGSCEQKYHKCAFWNVCKASNKQIAEVLLKRDFVQKEYQPLHHND